MPEAVGAMIISAASWVVGASITATEAAGGLTALDVTVLGVSSSYIVGTIALNGVAIVANMAMAPGSPKPQIAKVNIRNPVAPRRRYYGKVRIGGVTGFIRVSVITGDGILYILVMLQSGEIASIEEYRLSDQITRVLSIASPGLQTAIDGWVVYPAIWLDNNRVSIHDFLGASPQAADTFLLEAFPGAWTDDHRLDGIAYSVIKLRGVALEDFAQVYSFGIPNYTATIKASKVWDPRDATQSADTPSTWKWTDNAALIIMDYLWHPDGMRLPRSMIELGLQDWKDAADYCDEPITLISGDTEARYRLAGGYEFTEAPKDVLSKMLTPIDGRVRLREDGAIVLEPGRFETPGLNETFDDTDIIHYIDMRRGAPKLTLKNEIRATYTSPGHNFQQQEADPWLNQASIDRDGIQTATMPLDFCFSHRQARVQQKVAAYRLNPEWQGTIITNARGLNLLGKRYARFKIAELGFDTTFFITKSNIDLLNAGHCTFEVISFPAAAYDWASIEEGNSPENDTPGNHATIVPVGATSLTIKAIAAGGGGSDRGAGAGGMAVKTIAIDPTDWGKPILFKVGKGGIGDAVTALGVEEDGGDSTVTGTLLAGSIALVAHGGKKGTNSPGAGGTATGGDTNTTGQSGSGPDGGYGPSGAPPNTKPGAGGDLQTDGGDGHVDFKWSY